MAVIWPRPFSWLPFGARSAGTEGRARGPGEIRGAPQLVDCSSRAKDAQAAARLWAVSEDLTGVAFDFGGAPA